MEKKKLPNKRPISFSKANVDVNQYLEDRINSDPSFNYSDYICKLVRKDISNTSISDDLKVIVREAMIEVLSEANFKFSLNAPDSIEPLDDEVLESNINALIDL